MQGADSARDVLCAGTGAADGATAEVFGYREGGDGQPRLFDVQSVAEGGLEDVEEVLLGEAR